MVWVTLSSLWAFYDLTCFAPISKNPKTPDRNKEIHLKRVDMRKHYTQQWLAQEHVFLNDMTT